MTIHDRLREIRERAEAAGTELSSCCGRGKLRMSVPVRDDDSDMVISRPIADVPRLAAALERAIEMWADAEAPSRIEAGRARLLAILDGEGEA